MSWSSCFTLYSSERAGRSPIFCDLPCLVAADTLACKLTLALDRIMVGERPILNSSIIKCKKTTFARYLIYHLDCCCSFCDRASKQTLNALYTMCFQTLTPSRSLASVRSEKRFLSISRLFLLSMSLLLSSELAVKTLMVCKNLPLA